MRHAAEYAQHEAHPVLEGHARQLLVQCMLGEGGGYVHEALRVGGRGEEAHGERPQAARVLGELRELAVHAAVRAHEGRQRGQHVCDGLRRVRAHVVVLDDVRADVALLAVEHLHALAEQDPRVCCRRNHLHVAGLPHRGVEEAAIDVQQGAVRNAEGLADIGRVERGLREQHAAADAGRHGALWHARVQEEVGEALCRVAHVARVNDSDALLRRGLPTHRVERLRDEQPEDVGGEADLRDVLPAVEVEFDVHCELEHRRIDALPRIENRARPVFGKGAREVQLVFQRLQVDSDGSGPRSK